MHAIELQVQRVLGSTLHPKTDGELEYRLNQNQRMRDIDYFVIALNRFRRSIRSVNKRLRHDAIANALEAFDRSVPHAKVLRDIREHFDSYDFGEGHLTRILTPEHMSYYWGPDDGGISFGGRKLSLVESRNAARDLYAVVKGVLEESGRQVDLSHWPLLRIGA